MLEIDCITEFRKHYLKKPKWYLRLPYKCPEGLISYLDPELTFVKRARRSSVPVFFVKKDETMYVLKVGSLYNPWVRFHLLRERRVLKKLRDVPGITHLVKTYATANDLALLKEYHEGTFLWMWLHHQNPENKIVKKHHVFLERTIKTIHDHGLAGLDIVGNNIIASSEEDQLPKIIDLGYARSKHRMTNSWFNTLREYDYLSLKELFDDKPKR